MTAGLGRYDSIMAATKKTLKTCVNGHHYYRTPDCPSCPACERKLNPKSSYMAELVAPARRALSKEGIDSLLKLSRRTEREILNLHGMGASSIPKLKAALKTSGLKFKDES